MKEEVIAFSDPKSPVSEMFKTLRTNIQFMNSNKPLKTLLVTSTLPGEGKSWTVANLAVTFAQAGKKVLIIDADMRKGRQFSIFEVPPTPGLSNYLSGVIDGESGDYELERFISKTELDNLYIIPSGNVPPNPTELLVSEKMLDLIKKVDSDFDITIFDGTPGLLVADASILSRIVDSSIIVTAHNETKIDNVSEVKKAIENIGGKVAGVVINKIPVSAKKYENTYYYGHTTAPALVKEKKTNKLFHPFEHLKNKNEEIEDETDILIAKQHELIQKQREQEEKERQIIKEEAQEPKKEVIEEPESIQEPVEEVKQEPELVQKPVKEKKEVVQEPIEEPKIEIKEEKIVGKHELVQEPVEPIKPEPTQEPVEAPQEYKIEPVTESEPILEQEPEKSTEDDLLKQINEYKEETPNNIENATSYINIQYEVPQVEEPAKVPVEEPVETQNTFEVNKYIPFEPEETIVEEHFEAVEPKLSWEQEAESAYERVKQQNIQEEEEDAEVNNTLNKTQSILDEINKYLAEERLKFKNGGLDD